MSITARKRKQYTTAYNFTIMNEAFLSTKKGFIDSVTVYRYDYSDWLNSDINQKTKFNNWLKANSNIQLYEIENTCFFTFSKLANEFTKQYKIDNSVSICAPYKNTQRISNLIAFHLKRELSKYYNQFLNRNTFIVQTIDLNPFNLLKVVEFNVEVFPSGHYLIHFFPSSKIVSRQSPITKEYFSLLNSSNKNSTRTNEMEFTLVNTDNFRRFKVDLLDKKLDEIVDQELIKTPNFIATFDYHFIKNFSPELLEKIVRSSSKDMKETVWFLNSILEKVALPDSFNLSTDKFLKVDMREPESESNLLVGCHPENITLHSKSFTRYGLRIEYTRDNIARDELITTFLNDKAKAIIEQVEQLSLPTSARAEIKENENKKPYISQLFTNQNNIYSKVKKLFASYYSGIYKAVDNRNILPIICGNLDIETFKEFICAFNKGATNFEFHPIMHVPHNGRIEEREIEKIIRGTKNKIFAAVFCQNLMPDTFFEPLKKLKIKYQKYQGDTSDDVDNRYMLSNFACRCLEKMGGIVATIANTHLPDNSYFIGIDLGHTTVGKNEFSNLAAVIFDNHGILIEQDVLKEIPRKENLIEDHCTTIFGNLQKKLHDKNLPQPHQLVIHRDGKLHSTDVESLTKAIQKIWGKIKLDIVEIIKSGFPVIAIKDGNGNVTNPPSGSSFQDNEHRYAILITNTQAEEYSTTINPIIIKHKFGEIDFSKIVDQVYWFTKVYTNNLYHSTRLPATTLKANNIVGTSKKQHRPTFLG